MPYIILVRHGKTDWNKEGRYQGKIDIPLNEEGLEQAYKVAQALREYDIKAVYTSPLSRALETAKKIVSYHPNATLHILEDLKEIDHGEWEGKLAVEIQKEYPELYKAWKENPSKVQMPKGENLFDVFNRAKKALDEIISLHKDEDLVCLVSHDATLKAIMCYILNLPLDYFWSFKFSNCSISLIYVNKEKTRKIIYTLNTTCHLGKLIDFEIQKAL